MKRPNSGGRRARWLVLVLLVLTYPEFARVEDLLSCGLGPPPGSAGFDEHQRAQNEQRQTLGYLPVCEGYLGNFDYASRAEPLGKATMRLAFKPVSLASTPFAHFTELGGRPNFFGDAGPAALHRTFKTAQGHIVDLREWDMSVGGGQVWPRADLQAEQVNGQPAQLTVIKAPSGKAVSLLAWVEGRRSYELSINTNVRASSVSPTLIELANAIPKSLPARLDEGASGFPPPTLPPPLSR